MSWKRLGMLAYVATPPLCINGFVDSEAETGCSCQWAAGQKNRTPPAERTLGALQAEWTLRAVRRIWPSGRSGAVRRIWQINISPYHEHNLMIHLCLARRSWLCPHECQNCIECFCRMDPGDFAGHAWQGSRKVIAATFSATTKTRWNMPWIKVRGMNERGTRIRQ